MKSTTYTATFSNGQTVTRTSDRPYVTAGAYIHKETGKMEGLTFSTSTPKETRKIYYTICRHGMGYYEKQRAERKNAEIAKAWSWEIVKVQAV